jgi:serine/threonine protein kinase
MDFADDGDLYEMICKHQKANRMIDEATIWSTFIETVRALNVLHSKNILHRDLKSANVFL